MKKQMHAKNLKAWLKSHFKGADFILASRWLQENMGVAKQQVDRWIENSNLVFNNTFYLQGSTFKESSKQKSDRDRALTQGTSTPRYLRDVIADDFNNSQVEFGKSYGVHQQQVNRWANAESPYVFFMGQCFRERLALPTPSSDDVKKAIELTRAKKK